MYIRKIGRSGGSYIVPIPMSLMAQLGWHKTDYLSFTLNRKNQVIIQKLNPEQTKPERTSDNGKEN